MTKPFHIATLDERMAAIDAADAAAAAAAAAAAGHAQADNDPGGEPGKPSQEKRLRDIATRDFTVFRAADGRGYGIANNRPGRALRQGSPSEIMPALCLRYLEEHGSWPSSTAQAAVAGYLTATTTHYRDVPMRCHWDRKRLLLDVGDTHDTTLILDGNGVRALNEHPMPFRRPPAAAPLPWPLPGTGDLDLLWKLVRVVEADRPIVLALLVMGWLTGLPQPVVLITGPADAGKTTTSSFLLSLIDPTTHQRGGSLPEREDQWKTRVAQSRVIFVDNGGHITAKQSDLMCRVATGGELTTRTLYTDDGAHVSDLLVPIWLTSIDAGVLRGDLQSRIIPVELESISRHERAVLSDLEQEQENARPAITRALLDLTDQVIAMLPTVDRTNLVHRMTDFNLVLRCVDTILGTTGETRLVNRSAELAGDVLDGDPVASALLDLIDARIPTWISGEHATVTATARALSTGVTAADLLSALTAITPMERRGRDWPATARVLSSRLRQIQPAMLQARRIRLELRRAHGVKRWTAIAVPAGVQDVDPWTEPPLPSL